MPPKDNISGTYSAKYRSMTCLPTLFEILTSVTGDKTNAAPLLQLVILTEK
jgi:hypothetical protein